MPEFNELRNLLKGRDHASPINYFDAANINKTVGVGQSKFVEWYKYWLGRNEYKDRTNEEKKALNTLLNYLRNKDTLR